MRSKVAKFILAETPEETRIFVNLYSDIVVRINQLLKKKGLNQKAFAQNLDKRPSEINKWLNGNHNFTIKSIAKIQAELGESIIYVPKRQDFTSNNSKKKNFTVFRNNQVNKNTEFNKIYSKKIIPNTYQPLANVG